ncbi:MAG: hypothetical protein K5799_04095 [Erythrobacter sp.]|nr:hypothetical protein [Erythrobacter sp.]
MFISHNDLAPDRNDQSEIAAFLHATEALLSARVKGSDVDYNFLMVAGEMPTHSEFSALGAFSCTRNWHVCYAYNPSRATGTFDPATMRFLCVFFADDDVPVFLNNGRLWADENSRRLAIAFSDEKVHLKLTVDRRGKLDVRQKAHSFSPKGYERALHLLRRRQAVDNSSLVVLTTLGPVPCTMDMRMFQRALGASA